MGEECGDNCSCDHSHPSAEQIAHHNNFVLSVLIEALIEKKVISKEDLDKKFKEVQEMMMKQAHVHAEAAKSEEKKK